MLRGFKFEMESVNMFMLKLKSELPNSVKKKLNSVMKI